MLINYDFVGYWSHQRSNCMSLKMCRILPFLFWFFLPRRSFISWSWIPALSTCRAALLWRWMAARPRQYLLTFTDSSLARCLLARKHPSWALNPDSLIPEPRRRALLLFRRLWSFYINRSGRFISAGRLHPQATLAEHTQVVWPGSKVVRWVTSGKFCNLSKPWCSPLQNGNVNNSFFINLL